MTLALTPPYLFIVRLYGYKYSKQSLSPVLLFIAFALVRLPFFFDGIYGSDDAYRYLWDGLVQSKGIHPYLYSPNDSHLETLRSIFFDGKIFRPDMRTVYPPLAELCFLLAWLMTPFQFIGLKVVIFAHELVAFMLLAKLLKGSLHRNFGLLAFVFSPLLLTQLYSGVHLDGLLLPWLALVFLFYKKQTNLAVVALACATMIRPNLALIAPALVLVNRPTLSQFIKRCALFICVCALFMAPYLYSAQGKMFESLATYGAHWSFNGYIYQGLLLFFENNSGFRLSLYGFIVSVAVLFAFTRHSFFNKALMGLSIYYLLSPTVYPWYLVPFVLFGALKRNVTVLLLPVLILLSDLVFLEGEVGGQWKVPSWAFHLEWLGLFFMLSFDYFRKWQMKGGEVSG